MLLPISGISQQTTKVMSDFTGNYIILSYLYSVNIKIHYFGILIDFLEKFGGFKKVWIILVSRLLFRSKIIIFEKLVLSRMEVINKPRVYYTQKSLQFFLKDKRKLVSAVVVVTLPIVNNLWRLVPEHIPVSFYDSLYMFVWTFSVHLMLVILAFAWFLSIPKKDCVLQFITLSAAAYGVYLTYGTIPFTDETPVWQDWIASLIIFGFIYVAVNYIKNNYLSKPSDYKTLHDGLVYDIHHQRFLGSINRIAGLLEVSDMEELHKKLCKHEIDEIKESIAYIADKYEELK